MAKPTFTGSLPPLPKLDDGPVEDEVVEVEAEEEPGEVEEIDNGDGTITIVEPEESQEHEAQEDHFANLVNTVDREEVKRICTDLLELQKIDKEARDKRQKQYEDGIKRTGLGGEAPGGAQFQGASRVVHPVMTEGCIDFASRIMKEVMPPDGPVKPKIIPKATKERQDRAERKAKHMNWQLLYQMPEFRSELEKLLTQVPLSGSAYMKMWYDPLRKRPVSEFIPIDDVFIPYNATSFYTSERIDHRQNVSELEVEKRIRSGFYEELPENIPASGMTPEESAAAKSRNAVEGKEPVGENRDGNRIIHEFQFWHKFDNDEFESPYIIHVDELSTDAYAIYRNWEMNDEERQRIDHFAEATFLPWDGAYGIGLPHIIGSLSGALTGMLRAVLDTAHIQNTATMIKLKGSQIGGQTPQIEATQVTEIQAAPGVDDIRKVAMPLPFNPPSPTLVQLIPILTDMAKGVVRTSLEEMAEQNANTPVGTTLSRVEQGLQVYAAIFERMHNFMAKVLDILHRLDRTYIDEESEFDPIEGQLIYPQDYAGPMDIIPVSNPRIFTEAQRIGQLQVIAQRAASLPQVYDQKAVERRLLEGFKIPNWEELLINEPEAESLDPISENVLMGQDKPVKALIEQDHMAHIMAHMQFMMDPMLGGNMLMKPIAGPRMLGHIKDHLLYAYAQMASVAISHKGVSLVVGEEANNPAVEDAIKQAIPEIHSANAQMFGQQVSQFLNQLQQEVSQMKPPQPIDPGQAAIQSKQIEVQGRMQEKQMDMQLKQQELQLKGQDLQIKQGSEQQQLQLQQAQMVLEERRVAVAEAQAEVDKMRREFENQQAALAQEKGFAIEAKKQADEAALKAAEIRQAEQAMAQAQEQALKVERQEAERLRYEMDRADRDNAVKLQMNAADNETALEIARMKGDQAVAAAKAKPPTSGEPKKMKDGGAVRRRIKYNYDPRGNIISADLEDGE